MKRMVLISLLFALIMSTAATASPIGNYVDYNLKIGQLIFKELSVMEKANEAFNLWMKGDLSKSDALSQLGEARTSMEACSNEMQKIAPPASLQTLNAVYSTSSSTLINAVKKHISFVSETNLKADDIRDRLQKHLLAYVDSVYDCQIANIKAQIDFQEKIDLTSDPASVKEYFAWNNKILKIMLGQVSVSKEMEKMLIKLSTGGIDIDEAQKEEKELRILAEKLKKSSDAIVPAASVRSLHSLFGKSLDNYLVFHRSLEDYLAAPTRDKSDKMKQDSKAANNLSFEFNEECYKFLQKNSKPGNS
jgi:hypothetical protein